MNVFRGENSLIDYFNPDKNPPLPLVELPKALNPYYDDGVRVYAKMLTVLPATNVKSLPGKYNGSVANGLSPRERKEVVEGGKGSTGTELLRLLYLFFSTLSMCLSKGSEHPR